MESESSTISMPSHLPMYAMRSAAMVDPELRLLVENETQSCPGTSRSSRRKERGMLERKFSTCSGIHRPRKWLTEANSEGPSLT
mgnify:CR=1 FL=1